MQASGPFMRTDATNAPLWQPTWQQPGWTSHRPRAATRQSHGALDAMIARHAAANGLPVELVHRVVIRESRYNPRARNGGNLGLMQIKHATARGVGYTGSAAGLLDAETNLTYAVRYLAGAYRAAGGNASRAVSYYASGYHGRGVRRQPALQQAAAWSPPSWEMQPVSMRDTDGATDRPRARRHSRRH
jgi:soluble lytic murein transglycosylase-like protein